MSKNLIKRKIAFCGDFTQNNGPANVNKELIKYFDIKKIDTKCHNKIIIFMKFLISLFYCKIYIFSSNYRVNYILFLIANFFKKKTIYLMHGSSYLDSTVNKIDNIGRLKRMESTILKRCTLVLTVSEKYMILLHKQFPNYKSKIYFLTNGISVDFSYIKKNMNKNYRSIAVCGGNRFLKCNKIVSDAINELNKGKSAKYNLNIYGLMYANGEKILENDNVKIIGRIPQNELFEELSKTKLFVLNSMYESFGLSVIDALKCGCNILISKNAGINDVLKLEENDIINDFNDIDELKQKIKYNMTHDNNKRILDSIDFKHYNWESVAQRLIKIICCLENGESYKNIR